MRYIHDKKIFKVFINMKPEVEEGELIVMDLEARTQINPWQGTTRSQTSTEATAQVD